MSSDLPPLNRRHMILSVTEVAAIVERSPETVRRWVASGDLPMEKVAGAYAIPRGELAAWLRDIRVLLDEREARWQARLATSPLEQSPEVNQGGPDDAG